MNHTPTPSPIPAAEGGAITELVVCTTCRPDGAPRDEPAPGERLLLQVRHQLMHQAATLPAQPEVRVRGTACLSSCSHACTIALQASGKHSYVFGDLAPDGAAGLDTSFDTATQILACARQHAASPDGLLAWRERPERLRRGIVARLPPLGRPCPSPPQPQQP